MGKPKTRPSDPDLVAQVRADIEASGLGPDTCHLARSEGRLRLVTVLPDGTLLDWFDDRPDRVIQEMHRQLIAMGVDIRDT